MADQYEVADGYNNAAGLAALTPQGATPNGLKYPETDWFGSGGAEVNGELQTELVWNDIDVTDYNTLRTQLGITDTAISNLVTIRLRTNTDTFANYNAIVVDLQTWQRTPIGRSDFRVLVKKIEAI